MRSTLALGTAIARGTGMGFRDALNMAEYRTLLPDL